jgi:nitronate monooxygenase
VPAVIDAVGGIPVVAAGGIADGRGLAAVLMLGAEGVWIGTRFVSSVESISPAWMKERVVQASTDDTVLTRACDLATAALFPSEVGDRVLQNEFTATWHGRDEEVIARRAELAEQVAAATKAGDARIAAARAGCAAGLIGAVEPAGEIVRSIIAEAEQLMRERTARLLR